jgi:hypothetical protein
MNNKTVYFTAMTLGFIGLTLAIGMIGIRLFAQPSISQSYGLTLERDDFPFAAPTTGQPTVFQTAVATRSSFAIVYRNGLLQRPCGMPPGPCDYTPTGNVTVTFPVNVIQAGDLVTVFFYR